MGPEHRRKPDKEEVELKNVEPKTKKKLKGSTTMFEKQNSQFVQSAAAALDRVKKDLIARKIVIDLPENKITLAKEIEQAKEIKADLKKTFWVKQELAQTVTNYFAAKYGLQSHQGKNVLHNEGIKFVPITFYAKKPETIRDLPNKCKQYNIVEDSIFKQMEAILRNKSKAEGTWKSPSIEMKEQGTEMDDLSERKNKKKP